MSDTATAHHRPRSSDLPRFVPPALTRTVGIACAHMGATAPNPPVGCVLLDEDGTELAEGGHARAGEPHAEARALARARETGVIDRVRHAVVTLEPCAHVGRTPPCVEALIASPVQAVWIGAADPNPEASGGMSRLRAAGRRVEMLDDPLARALIAPFARRCRTGLPWISIKQAISRGGSMIPEAGAKTFTRAPSLDLAHRLRRATDAIVTGAGTVLADDPGFDVRRVPDHAGRGPRTLIVCDRRGRLPEDWAAKARRRFDLHVCRDLERLPEILAGTDALWAMVEGGPGLLAAIEAAGLWDDRLRITADEDEDRVEIETREGGVSPLSLLVGE